AGGPTPRSQTGAPRPTSPTTPNCGTRREGSPGPGSGWRCRLAGAGAGVLHRGGVARAGRACRRVPGQGQPGDGDRSAPAAHLDGGYGSARQVEVVAEELGPSLRWATATPTRVTRSS